MSEVTEVLSERCIDIINLVKGSFDGLCQTDFDRWASNYLINVDSSRAVYIPRDMDITFFSHPQSILATLKALVYLGYLDQEERDGLMYYTLGDKEMEDESR